VTRLVVVILVACGVSSEDSGPSAGGSSTVPNAEPSDQDGDGVSVVHDCDDHDPEIWPGAPDPPYDGVDANCDDADDFDADGDGAAAQAYGGLDCDDTDPARYAGAPRICGNDIDDDCDAEPDCDLRGELLYEDVAAGKFTGRPDGYAADQVALGDVDADGNVDLLMSSWETDETWLFLGPLLGYQGYQQAAEVFDAGSGGVAAGDFDGDGIADVAVTSSPLTQWVYTSIWASSSPLEESRLEHEQGNPISVGRTYAGDTNADGLDDLVLGGVQGCTIDAFWIYGDCIALYHAPFDGVFGDEELDGIVAGDDDTQLGSVGFEVSRDLTGDGAADVVVVDPLVNDFAGRAYVFSGPLGFFTHVSDATSAFEAPADWGAGVETATTGDLDGDGYHDLAVGTSGTGGDQGGVWVVPGPLEGAVGSVESVVELLYDAREVLLPGDLDGDGKGDLAVIGHEDETSEYNLLILYAPEGTVVADATFRSSDPDWDRAWLLSAPGDINGDGLADLVAGGRFLRDGDGTLSGGAWVILGVATGF
jgi:hypothetical protein